MGLVERREREKQELRQRIFDAARELFAKHGYEAVTMRKIAEAIEYSPTALYLYFKDKEELLRELCAEDFHQLAHHFQAIAGIADPVERLRQTGLAYVEFGLTHPNHYRLMFMTPEPCPPSEEVLAEKGNPEKDAYAFVRMIVQDCIAQGRFREDLTNPDAISQIVWAGVHGLVSLHIVMHDDEWICWCPIRKLAEGLIDTQLNGLLRRPNSETAARTSQD
jgi:AcrR family transcriptional regulator